MKENTAIYLIAVFFLILIASGFLVGCTISLQNVSTHGIATDAATDSQTTKNDPSFTLPAFE